MGMSHNKFLTKAMFSCCKTFSGKYIFSGNANFRKRKIFPFVWLHFKKFSGKYFLVFGKEEGKHNPEKTQTQFKFFLLDLSPVRSREGEIAINSAILPSRDRDQRRDHAKARSRSTDLPLGSRDLPRRIFLSDRSPARSREGEIAINGSISRRRDHDRRIFLSDLTIFLDGSSSRIARRRDLAKARSRSTARSCRREIAFVASPLACERALSLSLSLSHIFRKCFEGKIEV